MMVRNLKTILVQEPSRERDGLEFFFLRSGLEVETTDSLRAMHRVMTETMDRIDAVVVTLGDDVGTVVRSVVSGVQAPVIAIVDGTDTETRVRALEAGAADVLQRPIDPRELVLRVRNAARAGAAVETVTGGALSVDRFGPWRVDTVRRDAVKETGETAQLTGGEYELLRAFLERPNRPLSRDLIMQATRGRGWKPFDRSIDVLVGRLRRKIEDDPDKPALIKTVRGIGYVLATEIAASAAGGAGIGAASEPDIAPIVDFGDNPASSQISQ